MMPPEGYVIPGFRPFVDQSKSCPAGIKDCDRACECDNGCMKHLKLIDCRPCCDGNACTYGCGACFCSCHDESCATNNRCGVCAYCARHTDEL